MDRGDITACRCMRHACIKMILDRWTCCQYSIKKRYIHLHTNNPCKAPSLYRDLFVYAVVTPSTLHFAERYYLPDVIFCLTQTDTAKRGQCLFRMHIQRQNVILFCCVVPFYDADTLDRRVAVFIFMNNVNSESFQFRRKFRQNLIG